MSNRVDLLEKRLQREIKARKEAESLLESKSLELYRVNQELLQLNQQLEEQVDFRNNQLIQNELKYNTLIDNMDLGLIEVNKEHRILKANKSFIKLLGYTEQELLGMDARTLLPSRKFLDRINLENDRRLEGQSNIYENCLIHKNGQAVWVLLSGTPVRDTDGEVVGSIGIHFDITYMKDLQRKLEQARQDAEQAREAEKQFLANMSHEIRTPLNAIIGMSHLLMDTSLDYEQKEYISVLQSSSEILLRLISDVLDFSKIESGQLEMQKRPFNLVGIVELLKRTYQLRLEGTPVRFELNMDAELTNQLEGDDLLLNQMLNNLLSNAEKFTEKGTITLDVHTLRREEDQIWVRFQVRDTGIGIAKADQEHIFKAYRQAKSDTRIHYGGTGLGLPITLRLADLMGGKVSFESQEGKGTTFTLDLPFIDTGKPLLPSVGNTQMTGRQPDRDGTVLVVEDNAINRKYISTLLNKWEIPFDFAFHGGEAVDKCMQDMYSVILMDLQMPEMNGYEAALAIRNKSNPNCDVPIIALTASAIQADRDRAFQCGMNGFLSKPITPGQLSELLGTYWSESVSATQPETEKKASSGHLSFDMSVLREFYGDDLEYAKEMFDLFLSESEKSLPSLERAVDRMDGKNIKAIAHRIKPSVRMVGFTNLADHLQNLERAALADDEAQVTETYGHFRKHQSTMLRLVKEFIQDIESGAITHI